LILRGTESLWGTEGFLLRLTQLCLAGGLGLAVFAGCATLCRIPEMQILANRLRQRLRRR
jgi:putative peptidoglycan lipid II flippase